MTRFHEVPLRDGQYILRITTGVNDDNGIPWREAMIFDGQYAFARLDSIHLLPHKWFVQCMNFASDAIERYEASK